MSFYDIWWPLVFLGLTFLIPELLAHFDKKPGGTLSEWVWVVYALRWRSTQKYKFIRRWIFSSFWVGLTFHFIGGMSVGPVVFFGGLMVWPIYYRYTQEM